METKRKILVLAANSKKTSEDEFGKQVREIKEALKLAKYRDQFELEQRWAVRPRDIRLAMLDHKPQIVHFLGRAAGSQGRVVENEIDRKLVPEGLVLEDETGQAKPVSGEALAALFKLFDDKLECVVLNNCYSKEQAEKIAKYIPYVIGTKQAIGDRAAMEFAVGFYDALGGGCPVEFAYKLGRTAIQMAGLSNNLLPVLLKKELFSPVSLPQVDPYEVLLNAITDGQIIPVLGPEINLCDRSQKTEEPESWRPGTDYPPTDKELAAYLATAFGKFLFPQREPPCLTLEEPPEGLTLEDLAKFKDWLSKCPGRDRIRKNEVFICPLLRTEISAINPNIEYLSQYVDLISGRLALYRKLHQLFDVNYKPNKLHKFLADLPKRMRDKGYPLPYPLIVTTNYDDTLERAFDDAGQPYDLVSYITEGENCGQFLHQHYAGEAELVVPPNEYDKFPFDKTRISSFPHKHPHPVILKLYGAIDRTNIDRDNFVITENQYIDYIARKDFLPKRLKNKLLRNHILFLGYDPSDWKLRLVLRRIWHEKQLDQCKSWAVKSNPRALEKQLWEKRGVYIHNISLEDFVNDLNEKVDDLLERRRVAS